MKSNPQVAARLHDLVRRHNGSVAADAALKAALGIVFSFLTFGLVYWFGWFVGVFVARQVGLQAWQFGAIMTGLFLIVATWSAWRRVDPLAGVPRMTDRQWLLTVISQASPDILYFSPRHASAGLAMLLLGGPAGIFQAIGIWAHRLPANDTRIAEAARLLAACEMACPIEQIRDPAAAFLLKRLALIKLVPGRSSQAFALTEKGIGVLGRTSKGIR